MVPSFSLFSIFPLSWLLWLLIPPCFLAGLALALVGWRARPHWSNPACARCGYDLRGRTPESSPNCPECGAALANKANAVRFARGGRHVGILTLALVLWLLPFLEVGGIRVYRYWEERRNPSAWNLSKQPTSVVLQTLAKRVDAYEPWWELQKRLDKGALSPADVGAVVEQFIAFLQNRLVDDHGPFQWAGGFVDTAWKSRAISDEQMIRVAEAYHGATPRIEPLRLRASSNSAGVAITLKNYWAARELPVRLYNELRGIRLDGRPVGWGPVYLGDFDFDGWPSSSASELSKSITLHERPTVPGREFLELRSTGGDGQGTLHASFSPGAHTLEVEVESALIDTKDTVGLSDDAPAKEWPRALRRWRRTGTLEFTVYPDDAQLVELVTDPASDPKRNASIRIEPIVVRPNNAGSRVVLQLHFGNRPPVTLSLDVQLRIGEEMADFGSLVYFGEGQSERTFLSNPDQSIVVAAIPEGVRQADVIFRPNPRHVDPYPEVTRIWGKEIVIEKVPLRRYDTATQPANDK